VTRSPPWLLPILAAAVVACGGAAPAFVLAWAWSFDGSRAWWIADLRALVVVLGGLLAAVGLGAAAGGVVLAAGSGAEAPPPGRPR
jgi:hypothetical protein